MLIESADFVSANSSYYVVLPQEYKIEKDCPFKEIFICSDLKKVLSEGNIEPSKTLFIEYTVIEETGVMVSELSGRAAKGSEKTAGSEMKLRLTSRILHYSEEDTLFEDRFLFEPDLSSGDMLNPLYRYQKELLGEILSGLGAKTVRKELNYFVNHFQAVYPRNTKSEGDCRVEKPDIDKEIEAEMLFEEFYRDKCQKYIGIMKNYSCGILYEGPEFPFLGKDIFNKGDLIISFCGINVYGFYTISNAYITGRCEKERKSVVIRDSLKTDLGF